MSDEKKWKTQLAELSKLPTFCRVSNFFSILTFSTDIFICFHNKTYLSDGES